MGCQVILRSFNECFAESEVTCSQITLIHQKFVPFFPLCWLYKNLRFCRCCGYLLPSNLYPPRWFNCHGIDEQLGAEQGSLPFRKKTVLTSDARRGQTFFTSWPTLNTQSVSCVFVLSFKPNHSIAMIWP